MLLIQLGKSDLYPLDNDPSAILIKGGEWFKQQLDYDFVELRNLRRFCVSFILISI